jgi:hypothetical protein
MVARNRYDTSLPQSGTSEFQILKRKGMKHVGANRSLNLERSKASRYGGLYSRNQSQQKLREYYHDKFVNQEQTIPLRSIFHLFQLMFH